MTFVRGAVLLICSLALLPPVKACDSVDGYDRGYYEIAEKGFVDGIKVNFPNFGLSELYDMPGVPYAIDKNYGVINKGSSAEDYAKALQCWANAFGIAMPTEAVADLLKIPADGGFDDVEVPYEVRKALNEHYYYDNATQPILLHHIMRDIVFMQTMQHSIREWEQKYITSLKAGDFLETEAAYKAAEDIFNVYLEYQETRDYQNILLSVLFGAGENEYGKLAEGTLPSATKGYVKGILTDIAKNKLSFPGAKPVSLEVDKTAIAEFVASTFITYYDNLPGSNSNIVLLLDIGSTTVFSLLKGGFSLLMAPGAILSKGLIRIAELGQNTSKGAQLVNYYFLAKHYPDLVKNNRGIFNEYGALHLNKRWGNYKFHLESVGKINALKANTEAFPTLELLTSAYYGMHEAITSNKEAIDALYGMANFFIAVDQLDITQLKKNLTGFAYLKYLQEHGRTEPRIIDYDESGASLTAQFKVNGQATTATAFTTTDTVDLSASIKIDAQDVGQTGDIFVVVSWDDKFFMKNRRGAFLEWDGHLDTLAATTTKTLQQHEFVNIVSGLTGIGGQFGIYVGYRNSQTATLAYNATPIAFRIAVKQVQTPTTPGEAFRDTLKDGSLGPEMVWIPAGTFRMGDIQGGGYSDELPVHEVSVSRFAMGRYEVTFAEYDKFAEATGRSKPDDRGWGRGNRPVIYVSWDDATAYAEWLSTQTGHTYRLPTEAEWEYSARAGTETKYWWGNEIGSNNANCYSDSCGDEFQYTAPVGSFAVNPFGLFDTAGNIGEWTCSAYESRYEGAEQRCASKDSGSLRALRGGAWYFEPRDVRAAYRVRFSRGYRNVNVGLRLARRP